MIITLQTLMSFLLQYDDNNGIEFYSDEQLKQLYLTRLCFVCICLLTNSYIRFVELYYAWKKWIKLKKSQVLSRISIYDFYEKIKIIDRQIVEDTYFIKPTNLNEYFLVNCEFYKFYIKKDELYEWTFSTKSTFLKQNNKNDFCTNSLRKSKTTIEKLNELNEDSEINYYLSKRSRIS